MEDTSLQAAVRKVLWDERPAFLAGLPAGPPGPHGPPGPPGAAGAPGAAGTPGTVGARCVHAFLLGGTIASFQLVNLLTQVATYYPAMSSVAVGDLDWPLLLALTSGTFTITHRYQVNTDVTLTLRRSQDQGATWSTFGAPRTLLAAQGLLVYSVTLASGDWLGIHCGTGQGGATFNRLETFL